MSKEDIVIEIRLPHAPISKIREILDDRINVLDKQIAKTPIRDRHTLYLTRAALSGILDDNKPLGKPSSN